MVNVRELIDEYMAMGLEPEVARERARSELGKRRTTRRKSNKAQAMADIANGRLGTRRPARYGDML